MEEGKQKGKYIPNADEEKDLLRDAREKALRQYAAQLTTPMNEKEKYDFRRGFEYAVGWLVEEPRALRFIRFFQSIATTTRCPRCSGSYDFEKGCLDCGYLRPPERLKAEKEED